MHLYCFWVGDGFIFYSISIFFFDILFISYFSFVVYFLLFSLKLEHVEKCEQRKRNQKSSIEPTPKVECSCFKFSLLLFGCCWLFPLFICRSFFLPFFFFYFCPMIFVLFYRVWPRTQFVFEMLSDGTHNWHTVDGNKHINIVSDSDNNER